MIVVGLSADAGPIWGRSYSIGATMLTARILRGRPAFWYACLYENRVMTRLQKGSVPKDGDAVRLDEIMEEAKAKLASSTPRRCLRCVFSVLRFLPGVVRELEGDC